MPNPAVGRIGETDDLAPPVCESPEQRCRPGLVPVDVGDLVSLGEERLLLSTRRKEPGLALLRARRRLAGTAQQRDAVRSLKVW